MIRRIGSPNPEPEGGRCPAGGGAAKSVRVIGKGDKERLVPLPAAFGAVFGFWLKDQPRGEFVFARAAGQKPVSS